MGTTTPPHCRDPEQPGHELRAVLQPQSHAIAWLDAELSLQGGSDEAGLTGQLRVGAGAITAEESLFPGMLLCGIRKGASEIHDRRDSNPFSKLAIRFHAAQLAAFCKIWGGILNN